MTPAQQETIRSILSADLSALDNDRLLELCLLYRAAPQALTTFPAILANEIRRRFTPEEIVREEALYAVLQHLANRFAGPVPDFQAMMHDMLRASDRNVWFTTHGAAFQTAVADAVVAFWLAGQPDILHACLTNRAALGYLAQSRAAATAILSNRDACAQWQTAPDLWAVWTQQPVGMAVLAALDGPRDYLFASPAGLRLCNAAAITALCSHAQGMRRVILQPELMRIVIHDNGLRQRMIDANDIFQAQCAELYALTRNGWSGWRMERMFLTRDNYGSGTSLTEIDKLFTTPAGLVFAELGGRETGATPRTWMKHPDGTQAAIGDAVINNNVMHINNVSGVSFNGATFGKYDSSSSTPGVAVIELWRPI